MGITQRWSVSVNQSWQVWMQNQIYCRLRAVRIWDWMWLESQDNPAWAPFRRLAGWKPPVVWAPLSSCTAWCYYLKWPPLVNIWQWASFRSGYYPGQTHNALHYGQWCWGFVMLLAVNRDGGHLTLRKCSLGCIRRLVEYRLQTQSSHLNHSYQT